MKPERHEADLGRVRLSYLDTGADGARPVVLLLHGFGSNAQVNWVGTGWFKALGEAGYRVVAPDQRGHGKSESFYEPADYGPDIFAADAAALLDHLGIAKVRAMGFSMGARVAAWFGARYGERVERLVIAGMGEHIFGGRGGNEEIAQALEADELPTDADPRAHEFRRFATMTGSDLKALAACIRPSRARITPELVASITVPTLVSVGTADDTAGAGAPLADLIPGARLYEAPGLGHHKSVGDKGVRAAVLDFLA